MKRKLLWTIILGMIICSCKQKKLEMKEKVIKTNGIELYTES
ncbi:MAG: alpha/beta hydrolase, partial [Bacteroidales bacterium]|nr:alpha/beta hydrolase [Bacteroidales bacterium]